MTEQKKSLSEQMVEEEDREFFGENVKGEAYNPALTLDALKTPAHDAKLDDLGPAVLVRCQARIVQGNDATVISYVVITEKPEELVFESGPLLTTELVSTRPLTPTERKELERLLAD